MFYNIIRNVKGPNARRFVAFLILLLLPAALLWSIVVGTFLHFVDFAKSWASDLKDMIVSEVPPATRDFISVVRTGKDI